MANAAKKITTIVQDESGALDITTEHLPADATSEGDKPVKAVLPVFGKPVKGMPIPDYTPRQKSADYGFDKMEIGDRLYLPFADATKARGAVTGFARGNKNRKARKFMTETVTFDDPEKPGEKIKAICIIRLADPA